MQTGAVARNTQHVTAASHNGKHRRRTGVHEKLIEGEGRWEVIKEILGWVFNGATKCIKLAEKKQTTIMKEITAVLRIKSGTPFKRVEELVGEIRHASIGIPSGRLLFGPINQLLARKPRNIF